MKKVLVLILVAALAAPGMAFTAIDGVTTADETHSSEFGCGECHTAHAADDVSNIAPLWETDKVALQTRSDFVVYGGGAGSVSGSSQICMSCHDSTSAAGTTGEQMDLPADRADLSTLADMHPVSIAYDASGLNPKGLAPAPVAPLKLEGSNIECASCHDVHKSAVDNTKALRMLPADICDTGCHTLK